MIQSINLDDSLEKAPEEKRFLADSRPRDLEEFVGQQAILQSLRVFLQAAKLRGSALDHVLLHGPPGLGKTSLAQIIAQELDAPLKTTSAVTLEKAGDLIAVLSSVTTRTVLFVDEIHRLRKPLEEILYTAMEDSFVDILMGQGTGVQPIRLRLEPFTLIGATTRPGGITQALHSRFGITYQLAYYEEEEIERLLERQLRRLGLTGDAKGIQMLARRCCYTPRHALRLLRRCMDYATVYGDSQRITTSCVERTLAEMQIDPLGLDKTAIGYLRALCTHFSGGPTGIQSLSAAIGSHESTLEETVEPYLLRIGMIQRTAQGRVALEKAYDHLKISSKKRHLKIVPPQDRPLLKKE